MKTQVKKKHLRCQVHIIVYESVRDDSVCTVSDIVSGYTSNKEQQ